MTQGRRAKEGVGWSMQGRRSAVESRGGGRGRRRRGRGASGRRREQAVHGGGTTGPCLKTNKHPVMVLQRMVAGG